MRNQKYVVMAKGIIYTTSNHREAEREYARHEHARMEYWENKNDHNSARFLKKK